MEKWIKDARALHVPPEIIKRVARAKVSPRPGVCGVRIDQWTLWQTARGRVTLSCSAYIIRGREKDIPHLLYVACTDPRMFQSTKHRHYGCPEVYLPVRRKERTRT